MNLPSREECETWDQATVAFFMSKNQLDDCTAVVTRLNITGHRLLNLSDGEMSKFGPVQQLQIQQLVQDIKNNEGGLLNKLKSRIKGKPLPELPARDYRDRENEEQLFDFDYDNDMCDVQLQDQDDSYEPPPSHRVFTSASSFSPLREDYLDSCRNPPNQPPRKPFRHGKQFKQLPPKPSDVAANEEDYASSGGNDDNYVEPAEDPAASPLTCSKKGHPIPHLPLSEHSASQDFYEVPDKEGTTLPVLMNRLAAPTAPSNPLPPKPSPRMNIRRSPIPVQQHDSDCEYEVCDPDEASGEKPPRLLPKPLPRERSPLPPLRPKPNVMTREFESKSLPVIPAQQKTPPNFFSLDLKRPEVPPPQQTSPRHADRGSISIENRLKAKEKDTDMHRKPWFANTCDRRTAEDVLLCFDKDGAFMVRKSSTQDVQQPYTLVVFYKARVYNIPVRFIPATQQYALGREKKGEEYFNSVSQIIENHQRVPLVLIDTLSNTKDTAKLCFPVKPEMILRHEIH